MLGIILWVFLEVGLVWSVVLHFRDLELYGGKTGDHLLGVFYFALSILIAIHLVDLVIVWLYQHCPEILDF